MSISTNPPFTWKGKTYTEYEATQKQRSLESKIRVLKRQIYAFEEAGNEEALNSAKFKKRRLMQEYNQFSKAAGLKTRPNRMRVVKDLGESERIDTVERLIGLVLPDGVIIKETSRHLYDQITTRTYQRTVTIESVLQAARKPQKIKPLKYDSKGRPSKQYIGLETTIAVNPETGVVTTCWPTCKRIRNQILNGNSKNKPKPRRRKRGKKK